MQIGVKILIGVSVLTGGILGLSSLSLFNKKGRHHRVYPQHVYYYYPKANLYYDSSEAKYIIWDTTTNAWKKISKLPMLQADIGKNARIGPYPEPVWKDNQRHRMIYSVSLYSSPNDLKKQGNQRKKSSAKMKPKKEEKKSGIRRFFEDLFSSKKKKNG